MSVLLGLFQPIAIVIAVAIILSLALSMRVSKSIIKPINSLDLDNPENSVSYDELAPLLGRISAQRRTIDRQLSDAKQKQEEFRLITENMSEGLIVIDKDMQVLTYNTSALKLLDISQPVSGNVFTLNKTKGFREVVESALMGERVENEMSIDESNYNLIANPVYCDDKIIGAVIVILDVTESVKREQLRREFTSNVSHELKTPLTSISGFAEIMKSGGTDQETVIDFSQSIYDEAQRLITLVSDIIKISELDEKSVQYENQPIDLYSLSQEVAQRLKYEAVKKNVKISVIGGVVEVTGVRKILDEMVYNLCDNAIKYNKSGGTVDIIVTSSEHKAKLIVRDTGIGIPKSHQSRVFERFYRVDKSHSKAIGGTGLGLSIVKHGAVYHNAEVSLTSTVGVGTTVAVEFNLN
jgi:two-component system phosphate regulon sensor histidine kinase PhoR